MSKKVNKIKNLVTSSRINTVDDIIQRRRNRDMLRESQNIALLVLNRLDDLGWTQKVLSEKLGVTAQQVSKIVKGRENLTLESIVKIQKVLGIPILASFSEISETEIKAPEEKKDLNSEWHISNNKRQGGYQFYSKSIYGVGLITSYEPSGMEKMIIPKEMEAHEREMEYSTELELHS